VGNSDEVARALFEEVLGMEQSATYQAIVRRGREEGRQEGRAEEARRILLLLGETKFGPPGAPTRAAVEAINDLSRLENLTARLLSAGGWEELLAPPAPRRRRPRA
jgi:predicted transposase YdaD